MLNAKRVPLVHTAQNQRQGSPDDASTSTRVFSLSLCLSLLLTRPQALWFGLWAQEAERGRRGDGLEFG